MRFPKRTIKKFDYKPRYYKGDKDFNKIKNRFEEFRTNASPQKGLKNKIKKAIQDMKAENVVEIEDEVFVDNSATNTSRTVIYIAILLLLIFLFIIDFDLSIFLSK